MSNQIVYSFNSEWILNCVSVGNRPIKYLKNVKCAVGLSCSLVFSVVLVCSRYLGYFLLPHGLAVPIVLYCGFASTQPLVLLTSFLVNYELKMSLGRRLSTKLCKSCKKKLCQFKEKWERDVFIQYVHEVFLPLNWTVPLQKDHVANLQPGSQNWNKWKSSVWYLIVYIIQLDNISFQISFLFWNDRWNRNVIILLSRHWLILSS